MAKDYPPPFQRKWEQTHYQLKKYDVLQFCKRLDLLKFSELKYSYRSS